VRHGRALLRQPDPPVDPRIADLTIAIAPRHTNCEARGSLAVGVSLAVAGALLFLSRRKDTRRAVATIAALLGLFAILLPTTLIGTCATDAAVCNTTMKPIMLAAGGLALAASVLILVVNELSREEPADAEADA
jgi:predicted membrane channel-forming protein YqfA (hemolysin III family)